jgi:hypothetical protein
MTGGAQSISAMILPLLHAVQGRAAQNGAPRPFIDRALQRVFWEAAAVPLQLCTAGCW